MLSRQEKKPPQNIVTRIRELAREKNEAALRQLLNQDIYTGIYDKEKNAIIMLAEEGDTESVDFLINQFDANINYALQGYAAGGHFLFVQQLLAHGANPHYAALGFALGGHQATLDEILKTHQKNPLMVEYAIYGFAAAGNADKVNDYLNQEPENTKYLAYASFGFGLGGHEKEILVLLEKYRHADTMLSSLFLPALRGFAMGHHKTLVNQFSGLLLKREAEEEFTICHACVQGYAMGGHNRQVTKLINASRKRYQLLLEVEAVRSYAFSDNVLKVLQKLRDHQNNEAVLKGAVSGFHSGGFLDSITLMLELMTRTHNTSLNQLLAKRIKGKLSLFSIDHVEMKNMMGEDYSEYEIYRRLLIKAYTIKPHLSQELKDCLMMLAAFLKEKERLVHRSRRENITSELFSLLLYPSKIAQKNTANCGAAIYLRELVAQSPLRFIMFGINLSQHGKSSIPFQIDSTSEINCLNTLSLTMMCALRHSTNWLGYSKNSLFESLQGATLPKDFELWFEQSGFEIILDNLTLHDSDNKPLAADHLPFGKKIYSDKHVDLDSDAKIARLTESLAQSDRGCFALISSVFTQLLGNNPYAQPNSLAGIDYGHYVKIEAMSVGRKISLSLFSWGKTIEIKVTPDYFAKHCHGILITKFNQSFSLEERPDKKNGNHSGCGI